MKLGLQQLLNKVISVQECDARNDANRFAAWNIQEKNPVH